MTSIPIIYLHKDPIFTQFSIFGCLGDEGQGLKAAVGPPPALFTSSQGSHSYRWGPEALVYHRFLSVMHEE